MIGLDVTREIVLTPNRLEYMCRLDPEMGEFIRKITGFYMDFHWEQEGIIGCVINDPLAVAYLLTDPCAMDLIALQSLQLTEFVVVRLL